MFTGIVQSIVTITERSLAADGIRLTITAPRTETYVIGDSILLNGICSTVVAVSPTALSVEYMSQSRMLTTVNTWQVGAKLNSEPPLTLNTKLSGSLVTGHVDTTATVAGLAITNTHTVLSLILPQPLSPFLVAQGSITVDGVNLTIAQIKLDATIDVHIIPHTLTHTIIQDYHPGLLVNIEYDYFAKLVLTRYQQSVGVLKMSPLAGVADKGE